MEIFVAFMVGVIIGFIVSAFVRGIEDAMNDRS